VGSDAATFSVVRTCLPEMTYVCAHFWMTSASGYPHTKEL